MSEEWVELKTANDVARITLNRDQTRNALTRQMLAQLAAYFAELSADSGIRLIELGSTGTVFCAGMDLGEMKERASQAGPSDWAEDAAAYKQLLQAMLNSPQPILAIVQGPVLAGGVGLVLACDLVIASEDTFFSLPEPQRGITAAMVTPLLIRKTGVGNAAHLLLSGQRVLASQMQGWGVCQQVVSADLLREEVQRWRSSVLQGSPQALAATKSYINRFACELDQQLDEAAAFSAEARATEDAEEGLAAFLQKRKPDWQPE